METGSNKSLFTLIAVVVFGIFLSLSYLLFQDNLKGVLANVMDKSSQSISRNLDYSLTTANIYMSSSYFDNATKTIPKFTAYGFSGTPTSGFDGTGLVFDGYSDNLVTDDKSLLVDGTQTLTYEVWLKINKFPSEHVRDWDGLFGANNTGGLTFGIDSKCGDKLRFTIQGLVDLPQSNYTLAKNTVYHIVGILDSSTKTISYYVNGNLITTANISTYYPTFIKGTYLNFIGSYGTVAGFDGTVYQANVYNKVLTSAEIQDNYNKGY